MFEEQVKGCGQGSVGSMLPQTQKFLGLTLAYACNPSTQETAAEGSEV